MARIGTLQVPTKTITVAGQSFDVVEPQHMEQMLNRLGTAIDLMGGGYVGGTYTAADTVPTAGTAITTNPKGNILGITWDVGDEVKKKTPTISVVNGHTYVLLGWVCTAGGNTGTASPPTFQPFYGVVAPF